MNQALGSEQRPISARDLAQIRDIGGHYSGAISVSPDGSYVAFQLQTPKVEAGDFDLKWYVAETKVNGRLWEVGNGGDLILNPDMSSLPSGDRPPVEARWTPDNEWIFYLKRYDGKTQIWRSHRDGSKQEQLTHNSSDVLSFEISDDGKRIYFTVSIPSIEQLIRRKVEADRGFLFDERFDPSFLRKPFARMCGVDGTGRVDSVSIERTCEPSIWIYDIATRTGRKATFGEVDAYRSFSEVSEHELMCREAFCINRVDGDFIWLKNEKPEKFPGWRPPVRLFASLNGSEFRCSAKECYAYRGIIEDAWWRPGREEIIFQRADGTNESMTGLYSWKPASNEIRRIILTEDKLKDCEIFESRVICLHQQWTHPRTISSIDLDSGDINVVYDPNPEFDNFEFSKIEKIEWEDQFGNPTHGHLVYPLNFEEGRRYPLVITTYRSRGFLRGGVGDEYPIHVLAAKGFMVLSHDMPRAYKRNAVFRSPVESEYEDLYERRSSLSAQEKILDILNNRGLIDPKRVAITGLSEGASQVTFALINTNRFAAAIAGGILDYGVFYYSNNEKGRSFWRSVLGGAPSDAREGIYRTLSIGLNAEQVHAPLLINVSDFELHYYFESFERLQDAGKPVEMYVFSDEYHIKWQPQHRLAIYRRNVQWLEFWLMDKEESTPLDRNQYKRWRQLREIAEKSR